MATAKNRLVWYVMCHRVGSLSSVVGLYTDEEKAAVAKEDYARVQPDWVYEIRRDLVQ